MGQKEDDEIIAVHGFYRHQEGFMNPAMLPEKFTTIINVVSIAALIVLALVGYLRGFVSQLYDILVLALGGMLGLLIVPTLAKTVYLVPESVNFNQIPFVGAQLVTLINQFVWLLIFLIIAYIIGRVFKARFIHRVLKYRTKILPDRIGGAVFAVIPVVLAGYILALMLSIPVFSNGSTILKATVLSPLAPSASKTVSGFIEKNPAIQLYDKISSGEPLDESDYEAIQQTLTDMDFPQNVTDVAMKFVKKDTITDEDIQTLKTYAQDHNINQETITGWLKDFGFSDAQIQDMMEKYK